MENQTTEKTGGACTCSILNNARIQSTLLIVFILLATFLFAETITSLKEYRYVGSPEPFVNSISVSGEGEVFAKPDTAEFTFTVLEEGATSGEVQEKSTKKTDEIVNALKEKGVEEKDIKTVGYDLYPKYEWVADTRCVGYPCNTNQKQVGFELNQTILVKVRDFDKAGELLELVASKNASNMSGLTFTLADKDSAKAEARKQAIEKAQEKAEKLAEDLGVTLVRINGFSEDGDYGVPMYGGYGGGYGAGDAMMSAESKAMPATVPAGENRIVSNVYITYEIR